MVHSPFAGMVGRLVAIHGLEFQVDINNMRGRITGVTYPVDKPARWIVALFCSTGSRTVAIKGANLWFLPDHWVETTRGPRFDQHGMLTHFLAPDIAGGTEVPHFEQQFQTREKPPRSAVTKAFGGTARLRVHAEAFE